MTAYVVRRAFYMMITRALVSVLFLSGRDPGDWPQ